MAAASRMTNAVMMTLSMLTGRLLLLDFWFPL